MLTQVLEKYQVHYISEAHCVLQIDTDFIGVTSATSNYDHLRNDVLELIEIQPEQIGSFKVAYHQTYLKKWLKECNSEYTFEAFWEIREECITALSV